MDCPERRVILMLKFSNKGKTLEDLSRVIKTAKVLPLFRFPIASFNEDADGVVAKIQKSFKENMLIIRSSAKVEDCLDESNAGRFKTVTDVSKKDKREILSAIKEVIDSYNFLDMNNEILVQPMLVDIKMSGVIVTADIDTLAPYYIINYDEGSQSNAITERKGRNSKTYVHFKESYFQCRDPYLSMLCDACGELEKLFNNPYLDIEFAFNKLDILYIFQVRPIVFKNKENLSGVNLKDSLQAIYNKIKRLSISHPNLLGHRAIFGVMPDWNPAEMIGLKPKQLALSLYKELITDSIWAYQRDSYGYRNLRSHPLLVSFLGVPYIDVRVDFNSFISKNLNEKIAKKLVEYYLDKLDATPTHHDKVEFEVIYSCYYLNLSDKLKELLNYGFNENEIKRIEFSLLELTNGIIDPIHGLYKKDTQKIEILKEKYDTIVNFDLPITEKIYWLVEDCKRYGTLPFAGIARAAFIAVQFLKSFVNLGIMTQNDRERFMNSLNTIAKKLTFDLNKLSRDDISKEEFLSKYGHLRPGTYDILSLRYDENFDNYFSVVKKDSSRKNLSELVAPYEFTGEQMEKINVALIEKGIKIDADGLIKFIKETIEGREYAKFIFSKSVSEILRLIVVLGKDLGISMEEFAYIDIKTILNLYSNLDCRSTKGIFKKDIEKNRELYKYTKAARLPVLIRKDEDIYSFFIEDDEPNFITQKRIESQVITEDNFSKEDNENKILFIKSADPGYDFLFTSNIGGLVTQFGGTNSHMAIRCAELGIPAVIGAGEKKFLDWSRAKRLEIDCANKQVRIVL